MGKASRGKRQRSRDNATRWTASKAAAAAHQMHEEALRLLPGNPRVQAWQALGFQGRLRELFSLLSIGAPSKEAAWDRTCSMMLGKSGYRPPWPATPHEAGAWNIAQVTQLLEQAEVIVLSPESHAAVMAAASTLEPADVNTLQRDRDFTALSGLLVLPEPVVTVNRGGSLSDIAAFGWQPITQHQAHPTAEHPAVQIVPLIDRDGPVQPDGWTAMLAQARAQKMPFPRLLPDGLYSLPLDGPMVKADEAQRAQFAEMRRTLHDALNAVAAPADPSDIGTWDGGRVDDSQDDFATRYMFAFWRLTAQGTIVDRTPAFPGQAQQRDGVGPAPGVRVLQLAARFSASAGAQGSEGQHRYHHRWPVRMHKVRQWYPSRQVNEIRWRGPYIKGPAGAPLLPSKKAFIADCAA